VNFSKAKFGQFFNTLRTESGLSLASVAKKTGLATTTVFSIEQGEGRVSMAQFFSVAKLFGLKPDMMLAKFCRRERAMSGLRKRARSQNTNGNKPAAQAKA
jgi:transcriptional regulator with XRE-family HTH domain